MNEFLPVLAYWVHDLDPVILHIWGPISLRWYGLAYVAGFIVAYFLWTRAVRRGFTPLSQDHVEELMLWGIVGVFVGGRLGYMLLYDFATLVEEPLLIVRVYQGGMSFHGGAIGGILAVIIVAWRRKQSVFTVGDLGVMGVAWGLLFGRLANFINGELWGKISTVPWAVVFPSAPFDKTAPVVTVELAGTAFMANPRHPSQLYEAALEGLLLGLVLLYLFWKTDLRNRIPGFISGVFIVGYAAARIVCELFREPDEGISFIWGFSRGTFYSFVLMDIGVTVMVLAMILAKKRSAKP